MSKQLDLCNVYHIAAIMSTSSVVCIGFILSTWETIANSNRFLCVGSNADGKCKGEALYLAPHPRFVMVMSR